MKPFQFIQPPTLDAAMQAASETDAMCLAGGTTLVDLMKLNVLTPSTVVSIKPLLDTKIESRGDLLAIGAGCTMAQVADNALVKEQLPMVRHSLILAASPQIRNMATIAGNLLQRTRSPYYRHIDFPQPGTGQPGTGQGTASGFAATTMSQGVDCSMMAVLGHGGKLIGTYPGDFGVAFIALNGIVHLRGPSGDRSVAAREFYFPPAETTGYRTAMQPGELIVGVSIPTTAVGKHSLYLKIRERSSYAFALASAAVGLQLDGQGSQAKIVDAAVGLGGLATIPWSSPEAEQLLRGRSATDAVFEEAAGVALAKALPPDQLQWKVTLAKRVLVRALQMLRDQGVPGDRDIWSFQHGRTA